MNSFYGAKGPLDYLYIYKDPGTYGQLTPNTVVQYIFPNINMLFFNSLLISLLRIGITYSTYYQAVLDGRRNNH